MGVSWQSQTLVVDGRGGGSYGSSNRFLAGCEAGVLMAVSDAGCGGIEAGVLMAVSAAGCRLEGGGFSWQSHTLVVGWG